MNRMARWSSALGAAVLLTAGCASTKVTDSEDLHGLNEEAAYRTYITEGLVLRTKAFEEARRAMLFHHCSGLDKEFPGHPSPSMVAAADAVQKWMRGDPVEGGPENKVKSVVSRSNSLLFKATEFPPGELAEWDRFRESAQGKRALNIHALLDAMEETAYSLIDLSTARTWDWPLANLREMADATGVRKELDHALDQVAPGSAATLAQASVVPGENLPDSAEASRLRDAFENHSDSLEKAVLAQLTDADRQALQALERQPAPRRWEEVVLAWQKFALPEAIDPIVTTLNIMSGKATFPPRLEPVAEFCSQLKLQGCAPNSPLAQELEQARSDAREVPSNYPSVLYEIVKRVPEAGCP